MNYLLQRKQELLRRLGDVVNRTNYDFTNEIERDYFVEPSKSIGEIVFQHSDLKVNEKAGNMMVRIIFSILVGIA